MNKKYMWEGGGGESAKRGGRRKDRAENSTYARRVCLSAYAGEGGITFECMHINIA